MPRLPSSDVLGPRPTPQSARGITGYDGGAVGRALEGAGAQVGRVADTFQQEADAQAVFAARRQLDDWERANVFDPKSGAVSKMGRDAFDLPQTLPVEFDKASGEIGSSLTSLRQRQAFEQMAQSRREQIGAWADRHALQQRESYDHGQYEADISASANRTALLINAGQYDTAKGEVATMQTRTTGFLRNKGRSEEEIAQAVKNNTSKAHIAALNQLLENDKPVDADKYLKENSSGMNVEDLLRAQTAVSKQMDAHTAIIAATSAVQEVKPAVLPQSVDRLTNLVMGAESGGKRFGSDGSMLTSPKGAKGEMQVMDATNSDPGYGVTPAKDNSPDERARVGRDYLKAMIKEFDGNVPQALAAYNAGPGRVKQAIDEASKEAKTGAFRSGVPADLWFQKLPDETKAYVTNISRKYADGDGSPQMPTLADVHDKIRQQVGTDRPQRLAVALAEGTRQFDDLLKAKKGADDDAEMRAMQWLENNGGRFSQMPASLRVNLAPKSVDNVMSYGQKIAKGDDITDPIVFQRLAGDENLLKGLTDAQFYAMRTKLSQSDFERFATKRGELVNGTKGQKASDLDTSAVNAVLNNRLQQMGIDPTPKDGSSDAQRVGAIRKTVWDTILRNQLETGKKFTDVEINNRVDDLFTKSVTFQKSFLGIGTGTSSERLMTMKVGDIPGDVKDRLKADFKRSGITDPTDADLLGAYLHIKLAQSKAQ